MLDRRVAGFACVLGYIGLLAAICFLLAFLARKLPDNFNEAKFITFSMLIFCVVWITFVPAYGHFDQDEGGFIVGRTLALHYRVELSDKTSNPKKAAADCRGLDARCSPWVLMCPVINATLYHLTCAPTNQSVNPVAAEHGHIAESLLITLILYHTQMAKLVFKQMLGSPQYPLLFKGGDFTIGGAFSIHSQISVSTASFKTDPERPTCTSLNLREFRFAQTMIFAIEEINNSSSLLPNMSIGYKIYDTCGFTLSSVKTAMALMNGEEGPEGKLCSGSAAVHAIIGESESSSTIAMARIAGPFHIPVISHFATCACLSNRKEFPSFFRTIPSDYYQSRALAQLVKHFGWTWVGAVRSDNDYGNNGMATFVEAAQYEGVCIEYSEAISRTNPREKIARIVEIIKKSTSKVLVAFLAQGEMEVLLEEALTQNVTGLQWVGSESWITARHLASQRVSTVISSAIGFTIKKSNIPGLRNFLTNVHPSVSPSNTLLREFWETAFECRFAPQMSNMKTCSGSEKLTELSNQYTDVSELRISNNVYKAVYAVAHSLHNLLACGTPVNRTCAKKEIKSGQMVNYLKGVHFTTGTGEDVFFNYNGDPIAQYELVNWQHNDVGETEFVTVGYYDASLPIGQQFSMNPTNIVWAGDPFTRPVSVCSESCPPGTRQAVIRGKPICCFSCVLCAAGEISNTTDAADCTKCPLEFWSNADNSQCVLKQIEFLSFEETMGILLTVLSLMGACLTSAIALIFFLSKKTPIVKANNSELSFLLLFSLKLCFLCSLTFIGQPSEWSCMLRHTAFGITFALCISCILAKTIVVLMAFKATVPGSRVFQCTVPLQRFSVFGSTLPQVVICTLWIALAPPVPHTNNTHFTDRIILECDVGSAVGFWAVLGYIALLSILCFVLAFLARKLPDNFNEAKFITFSMLIFCAVWLTFIPAYVSSPGKFTVAVEIFAILASSFGLLFCIFLPKCYIILFRPHKNTRKHIMGKKGVKSQ
ncbi:extracellular calcium-sensing receptor-like [Conger conger]|uniref:extracellular calcium-sensing receptor-like n=1 Tax=Conger conger TaxID=82655 RepID=UPI002A5AE368|nr:extracellular calcium-sensing receptor-like [Conger conger]